MRRRAPGASAPETQTLAAQYVRMSTEHQQYSIDNQIDAIREFAESNGLRVIKTYADPGRSGLTLKRRPDLQRLLADVESGEAGFSKILVYDVSRFGRFQDPDEAAAYEHQCRSHGVQVIYCAESFDNVIGGIANSVVKHIKRSMAAEYSRDLSLRISRGKRKIVSQGFWYGSAPYGYERWAVAADGRKYKLAPGERKFSFQFRTRIEPGPPEAVEIVKRVYDLFLKRRMGMTQIALTLNEEGLSRGPRGSYWGQGDVRRILTKDVYCGDLVYFQTHSVLGSPVVKTPPSDWIIVRDAHPGIVTRKMLERARRRVNAQPCNLSDSQLIAALSATLNKHGRLTYGIVIQDKSLPCPEHLRKRFGSVANAFAMGGYKTALKWRHSGRMAASMATRTQQCGILRLILSERGYDTEHDTPNTFYLGLQRVITCAARPSIMHGSRIWHCKTPLVPWDLMVICRVPEGADIPTQFFVTERSQVVHSSVYLPIKKRTAFQPGPPLSTMEEAADRLIELACI
jgi:DNA invertase Pin-like site-specific DNA recombinase